MTSIPSPADEAPDVEPRHLRLAAGERNPVVAGVVPGWGGPALLLGQRELAL